MKVTLALAVALALAAGARAQSPPNDCATYCARMVDANCTGNAGDPIRNQYPNMADCMNTCANAAWTPGAFTNASAAGTGNNLGCRIYHAGVANSSGASVHCGHAGFTGGGAGGCGSYAENYCHYINTCGSVAPAAGCEALHADLNGTNAAFVDAAQSGKDDKTCRMYHLSVGFRTAGLDESHCAHGFLTSWQSQCGSVSDGYCDVMIDECGAVANNGLPGYVTDVATCKKYGAANMNAITTTNYAAGGGWNATGGDTTFCRTYHAAVAASETDPATKATHCRHASPSGGGACGSYCDVYCDLFLQNCDNTSSTLYSTYANRAACMTACAAFPADGTPGDASGNTVNCRIYHAAAETFLANQVHCEHSQQNPTSNCVGGTTTTTSGGTSSGAASTTGKEDSSDAIRAGAAMGLVVLAAAATL